MKTKAKIIISGLLSLALLTVTGCGSNGESSVETQNPVTPDNPEAVIPVIPVDPIPAPDPYKTAGWYGKTQVSATASDGKVYKHETAGVFGERVDSAMMRKTSMTFQVMVQPYCKWYFRRHNGEMTTTVTTSQTINISMKRVMQKESGPFRSRTSIRWILSNAPITIDLDGIYDVSYIEKEGQVEYKESKDINQTLLSTLHLVDVDNQTGAYNRRTQNSNPYHGWITYKNL